MPTPKTTMVHAVGPDLCVWPECGRGRPACLPTMEINVGEHTGSPLRALRFIADSANRRLLRGSYGRAESDGLATYPADTFYLRVASRIFADHMVGRNQSGRASDPQITGIAAIAENLWSIQRSVWLRRAKCGA